MEASLLADIKFERWCLFCQLCGRVQGKYFQSLTFFYVQRKLENIDFCTAFRDYIYPDLIFFRTCLYLPKLSILKLKNFCVEVCWMLISGLDYLYV